MIEPGDPIRFVTILACALTFALALHHLRQASGFKPRHIFVAAWCAHVLLFYAVYYLSGRWQPPFDTWRPVWPPVIVTHAALSLLALQVWRVIRGRVNRGI